MYSLSLNEAAKKMFIFKTILQVPVAQNLAYTCTLGSHVCESTYI